jgi:hypothetical protein
MYDGMNIDGAIKLMFKLVNTLKKFE